jgi:hypothetical protein
MRSNAGHVDFFTGAMEQEKKIFINNLFYNIWSSKYLKLVIGKNMLIM